MKKAALFVILLMVLAVAGCKTRSELRREQEMEKLKQEVSTVRGNRADSEAMTEDLKLEMTRLHTALDEQIQGLRRENEELKAQLQRVNDRVQAVEQKSVAPVEPPPAPVPPPQTETEEPAKDFETAKQLYDEGRYEEAIEILKPISKSKKTDAKKAHYLLAESYFASRDFASSALEYSEYRKKYPQDSLVPSAIYRQANAFRNMGKSKEARLFYEELIERHPKHMLAGKAKQEVKRLK